MKLIVAGVCVAVSLAALSAPASAAVVFDNPYSSPVIAECQFNTHCAEQYPGGIYALQQFTITSATTIRSISYTAWQLPSSAEPEIRYLFSSLTDYSITAPFAEGMGQFLKQETLETIAIATKIGPFLTEIVQNYANIDPIELTAGTYFLGIQVVSDDDFPEILGASGDGAYALYYDGLASNASFFGLNAVAVGAYDTVQAVPEPASWELMIAGLGLAGATMRRRKPDLRVA